MKIAIIGAGPAGLGAGFRLKELGYKDFVIFEKNSYPGGLCASFRDEKGFSWDLGGHVIHSNHNYFNNLLNIILDGDILEHRRWSWIRVFDRWVPYPFQGNIRYLPESIRDECLKGLKDTHSLKDKIPQNFYDWIIIKLGEGIAKHFMFPYNSKAWAYPLNLLSMDWIEEMLNNKKSDFLFKYPLYGGIGEIFRKMALHLKEHIRYNCEVTIVEPRKKIIYLSNQQQENYDILINTSPLDRFLTYINGINSYLVNMATKLKHNSLYVVGIGIKKFLSNNKSWVYFPDEDCPFYRVTYLSNYSPYNTVDFKKYSSLLCEIAYSEYKRIDKTTIIQDTIEGLIKTGIIQSVDKKLIISTILFDIEYAYPLPTLERDWVLAEIHSELEKEDIFSCGRFGAWKYEESSMHHVITQAKQIIDRIVLK